MLSFGHSVQIWEIQRYGQIMDGRLTDQVRLTYPKCFFFSNNDDDDVVGDVGGDDDDGRVWSF